MRINSISYNYSFKSNQIPKLPEEGITTGYDDSVSSSRRESIRSHLEEQAHLKYLDYYEMPKSDFAMEQMLKSWGLKTDKIDDKIIVPEELNCMPVGNNNFRAALPWSKDDYKKLKESGINTVICASPSRYLKDVVENNGMKYIHLVANDNYGRSAYIFSDYAFQEEGFYISTLERIYGREFLNSDKNFSQAILDDFHKKSRLFIDSLVDSVNAMQKGGCLIGCEFGTHCTSSALNVIDVFNPKGYSSSIEYLDVVEKDSCEILYEKLTPDDKAKMGWTKEFEEKFKSNFENL